MRTLRIELRKAIILFVLFLVYPVIALSGELPPPSGPITTKQALKKVRSKRASKKHVKTIKIKVQDMDLGELLVMIGKELGWNVIVDKTVSRKVSLDISKPIPLKEAFNILLKMGNLVAVKVAKDTYMVIPEKSAEQMKPLEVKRFTLRYARASQVEKVLSKYSINVFTDLTTNSLIVQGKESEIALASKLIEMLDTPDSQVVTEVVRLNNADPEEMKSALSTLVSSLKFSDVTVIPDKRTNSLILSGPSRYIQVLKRSLRELDRDLPQVLIAVDVIEVLRGKNEALGIDWGGGTMTIISERPVLSGSYTYGYGYYGYGGTTGEEGEESYFISPPTTVQFKYRSPMQIQAIINYLFDRNHSRLLASPRVLTSDGQEAKVMVGDRIPIINQIMTSTQPGAFTTTTAYQVQFVEVGVLLSIKPRVTSDGYIHLDIHPQVSTLKGYMEGFGGTKVPEIGTREAQLKVMVPDGEPIIIGGLIRRDERTRRVRVPFLGELPIIGNLFRSSSDENSQSEIVFVIRPKIIDWKKMKRSENPAIFRGDIPREPLDGKIEPSEKGNRQN